MAVAFRRNFKKRENRNVPDAIPRATKMKLSFKSHQVNGPQSKSERSEDILDCRDDAIKFFSGEIDPSINRVLMNHIMKSDQIENVRMKASCVFELSLSSKELCNTVQGKIIVLNGEECSSHEGSVATNTAECYRSEDILDCRDDAIKFFSGEIDPSINRVLMNHIMKSDQIENVRMKASCVFELSLSSKELCNTVQGKIIVLNGEECSSHGGSVVTNTAECYKSEDILDCRGDAIKFFSGEIDPSINRVLMNHTMKSEQIENVRMKASCVFELSLSSKELCNTVQGKIIVLNGEECSSHEGSVATNTAECYRSEDILDCRDDAIKFFSGEIDPSINRVLMNHIMKSDQIENVRMKTSCVFELSLSSKELCNTVQGKIIVLNGEECSSHEGSVATNTAECYRSEDILDCRDDAIKFFSGEIDPSINRVLMNHIMKSDQIENVRMKTSCVFELSLSSKELCNTVQGKIIVLNGEECSSHGGSVVTNTAECYRSEDILDCRDDAIKFFSGEIDPSINRVLMNHIMTSEQIENVRMKASCVFELSLSGKELCDTVQGKIIVLNGEECSSYVNGIPVNGGPLQVGYDATNGNTTTTVLTNLLETSRKWMNNEGIDISRDDIAGGFAIYAFDTLPDFDDNDYLTLKKQGNLRIDAVFRGALPHTVNCIVLAERQGYFEINQSREVILE
ncbi:unnamed protein product [Mytilus edulis]|uniref:Uncharacterized protein n=1 Tax=Mytilus edulis TaxID=6550 RepID=A0A8S3VQC4_MYTED|nr:unnamed protein product [Mytilus edulis]